MCASETYAGVAGTRKESTTKAAMENRRRVAEYLLDVGADVNLESSVSNYVNVLYVTRGVCMIFSRHIIAN